MPVIADPDIEAAMKDLLAINWDEIPDSVINETKKALSKTTEDKAGQEALVNVFRAAEASVEFSGVLVSLRMALDDLCGLSGEVSHFVYVDFELRNLGAIYLNFQAIVHFVLLLTNMIMIVHRMLDTCQSIWKMP